MGSGYKVRKRNLVSNLLKLFQTERLKVVPELDLASIFVQEPLNFKAKISISGHDSYEAWREGVHDDLVLATALACWYAEKIFNRPEPRVRRLA
jgi:hypothetical protein